MRQTFIGRLGERLRPPPRSLPFTWRRLGAGALLTLGVVGLGFAILAGSDSTGRAGNTASGNPGIAIPVARRTLTARDTAMGTLGYGDTQTVASPGPGTITWLPSPGATLVRGDRLFSLNGASGTTLMYGPRPAWRALSEGVSDGSDVQQLEANLVALGYDPSHAIRIDNHYDFATRAIVERWQRGIGLARTGQVKLGQVAFFRGARRVGQLSVGVGAAVAAGAVVITTTSAERVVTVKLAADKQSYVSLGDAVVVTLPDGSTTNGTIREIAKVAVTDADGNSTIDVSVTLSHRKSGAGLDQASVSVSIAKESKKNALVVPITALLAQVGGGYAVELRRTDGTHALIRVKPGLFADGFVEISGEGIREGLMVVVPQ